VTSAHPNRQRMTFGQFIARERRARAITQVILAERAGLHRTGLSLLERDRRDPRLGTLVALARALEVTPGDLVDSYAREAGL
jgi:transcriptional regulator with XRE-family HTH domain